jgi:uncharacterized protein (TIGR03435 family)
MRERFGLILAAVALLSSGGALGQAALAAQASAPAASAASAARPATAAPAATLTFDVASVHAADMAALQTAAQAGKMPKFGVSIDGLRAEYSLMSLQDLIGIAYKVKTYQISGPAWLNQARFNIEARMPEGATADDAPAMLQALLKERFKLVAHTTDQGHPVLALVAGKGGPKMKESSGPAVPLDLTAELKPNQMKMDMGDGPMIVTRNTDGSATMNMGVKGTFNQRMEAGIIHIDADHLNMDGFADLLTRLTQIGGPGQQGQQVVNETGLTGSYQVAMELNLADLMAASARAQGGGMPPPPPPPPGGGGGGGGAAGAGAGDASDPGGAGMTVYASVEKAGLKLEKRKAVVEQLVIDSLEKTPTEN